MHKTKLKNDEYRGTNLPFILLWSGSYVVLWITLFLFAVYPPDADNAMVFSIPIPLITLVTAFLQRQSIARFRKYRIQGWILSSILGSIFTIFIFNNLNMRILNPSNLIWAGLTLFIPVSLLQTLWLWRHVKQTWLWIIANSVAVLFFVVLLPLYKSSNSIFLILLTLLFGLFNGIVQAHLMHHLLTQHHETEKWKTEGATNEEFNQGRVQRLEEHTTNGTFEASGDEAAYQEAR